MMMIGSTPGNPERKYGIERLKNLGATIFEGLTIPTNVESWLVIVKKCFKVMRYPRE